MSGSLFSIGNSALGAAQAGLVTAGNNIANANTPGYSRQRIEQSANLPLFTGSGYMGQGVHVDTVQRQYDALLASEFRNAQSLASYSQAYSTQISNINSLLGSATSAIPSGVSNFFSSLGDVAANPADPVARQSMLSTGQTLVAQFNNIASRLSGLRSDTNSSVKASVGEVNSLSSQIAQLNRQIVLASQGGTQSPNGLLDQRDILLGKLSAQIGNSVVVADNGDYNVYLANGQALVMGAQSNSISAQPDPLDAQNLQLGMRVGGTTLSIPSSAISGGTLGGLLAFRDTTLSDAQNAIGRLSLALGAAFNAQQALGLDQNGAPGGDMFSLASPAVLTKSSAALTATISDYSALSTSDYTLKYDSANYTLTRNSDGTQSTFSTFPQTVDGVTLDLNPPIPAPLAGDSFQIQPTRYGAAQLGMLFSDPTLIAAAAPIRTSASTANAGSAQISPGSVTAAYPATPLAGPTVLTYTAATGTLSGFPAGSPVSVTANGVTTNYAAGAPVTYTPGATLSWDGIQVQISGSPAEGDTFLIDPNVNGSGDNRNALALGALQTASLLGGATLPQAYGQLTAAIGSKANAMQTASDAQASYLTQVQASQASVSGVNLDEEAADLLRYQQAYQAAGKMIGIASTLFATILNIQS